MNQTDSHGRSLLHLVAQKGSSKAAMRIIEKGGDVHAKDRQGWIPLQHAAANGHEQMLEVFAGDHAKLQQPSHKSLLESARLRAAIRSKDSRAVESLLCNHELDVNVSDYNGNTSLHLAAATGQVNVVTALLNRGASVHVRTVDMAYVNQCRPEYVNQYRLEAENFPDILRITPLQLAAENGFGEITEILLNYGASVNAAGVGGEDILDVALRKRHDHIGRMLLKNSATIERDRAGLRLFDAIYYKNKDIVQLLVENGADLSWISDDGLRRLGIIPYEILDILRTPEATK